VSILLRSWASLSVRLKIEVARVPSPDRVLRDRAVGGRRRSQREVCRVQQSAMNGYVVLDLARCTRQMRKFAACDTA
jgi:hypothetical protein